MITSGVIITIIICVTLVLISLISAWSKNNQRKQVNKSLDNFKKAFTNFEKNNQDNNDYFKKF